MALEDEGYDVTEAGGGDQGLEALERAEPDVVLLDLMLPDVDGFTVCREIRRGSNVPVIMVTARTDSHDVVAGLEAGADDYVTKPLVSKELSARIRALLRRVEPAGDQRPRRVEVGELSVGLDDGVVTRAGETLALTRTEFRLLVELVLAEGRICSREDLLERVWGYGYFGDSRIVDVHIRRLRTKVERDPSNPRHVVTVRGLGYRLAT
jgi:DNA-binding response OmpR family regulator